MPSKILLAPVGAGKTAYALELLAQTLEERPFAKVWVLLSGRRQEDAFRQRLMEQAGGRRAYFNVEFFTFYQLYHRLLNIAQQPPRMLDNTARYGLLRAILADQRAWGELRVFDSIAETPGFVRVMADFIYELKQNLITPEKFLEVAATPRDEELAGIYAAYQAWLQGEDGTDALVDREGEGWLALAVLREPAYQHIGRDVDLLLVDGYDQFTPLQAHLLMLVAQRAKDALITLTTVPDHARIAGRRFSESLQQLEQAALSPLDIRYLEPQPAQQPRPQALQHVVDHLFLHGAQPRPADGRIVFIEAPDPAQEAAAVLRRVKHLLLYEGAQPDDIVIALRDWPRYARHFATWARAYNIPLTMHQGDTLNQNPAVMALLQLLSLHETDYRRRDLLDVLRSPYFAVPGLGREQVEHLERISQQFKVVSGRQNWRDAVTRAALPVAVDEDDPDSATPLLDKEAADHLKHALTEFFHYTTPLVRAPLTDYVGWLCQLVGPDAADPEDDLPAVPDSPGYTLNMPAQVRQASAPGVDDRDLIALDALMHTLRALLSAESLMQALGAQQMRSREQFLQELRTAVNQTTLQRGTVRSGRVLVTLVADARGLPHRHIFIPGLSEGVFPAPVPEDPLYLDSERMHLREQGIPLETQAERANDDSLFYQLIGQARESLTLSRPTAQDGVPWLPSHLWRAVTEIVQDAAEIIRAHEIRTGQVVQPAGAACADELLLAVADALCQPQVDEQTAGVLRWMLAAHGDPWARIHHARGMELGRLARGRHHDHFTGRLHDPALIAYVASELGPGRLWSATQLNEYGVCGYRFFARRLLRLEALEEPEEGLDAARLGSINHAILEQAYLEIGQRGLAIAPEHADEALDILRAVAGPVLDDAPQRYGFAPGPLWEQDRTLLMRRLEALVRLDFSDENPVKKTFGDGSRYTFWQEAPFGREGGPPAFIEVEVNGRRERLYVQGKIDRIDLVQDGLVIMDYKSGTTAIKVEEMREGRNFQMMVYLHAAEQILAAEYGDQRPPLLGGLFWHIRNRKTTGDMRLDDQDGDEALEQARAHLGQAIAAGRQGDFTVQPRKLHQGRCIHYCEFSQLCRVAGTSRHKPGDRGTTHESDGRAAPGDLHPR